MYKGIYADNFFTADDKHLIREPIKGFKTQTDINTKNIIQ